jgi:hypothetical protein
MMHEAIELVRHESEVEMLFWKGEVDEGRVRAAIGRVERFFTDRPEALRALVMVAAGARKPIEALSRDDVARFRC